MAKLFGTDGIRGIVGKDLTTDLAKRLGEVVGNTLTSKENMKIIVGRDTRDSGEMLEKALTAGLVSVGCEVYLCGIVPTPAVAYLANKLGVAAGIVISASHNPPEYNGLKLIGGDGFKLTDEKELEIESLCQEKSLIFPKMTGKIVEVTDAEEQYIQKCISTTDISLKGMRIAIDCGHGAASRTTPEAFRRLGAEVSVVNEEYTGSDINVDCGSTNLTVISDLVVKNSADIGIAHDGDADRVLAVDESGNEIDGDMIMAICARELKNNDKLANNLVVATVMSNLGFVKSMEANDINLLKTQVGDRYVLAEMRTNGAVIGGEQSGHIIFLEHNTTGDGLVTAIQLASTLRKSGEKLSDLAKVMHKYPQVLVNVPVRDKTALTGNQIIESVIKKEELILGDKGRILVRPSGTENLIRVMAEAETQELAQSIVDNIVKFVKNI